DLSSAEQQRCYPLGRFEITIFVEDIIGRQQRLVRDGDRRSRLEQSRCVVKRFSSPLIAIHEADQQPGSANMGPESLQDLEVLGDKPGLKEEVLRRVTGDGKL